MLRWWTALSCGDMECGARGVRHPGSGCSWRQTQGGGGCEQVPSAGPTAPLHRNVWWDLGGWLRGPQPWARRRPRRTLGVPTSTLRSSGWVVRDPWGTSSLLCTRRRPPREEEGGQVTLAASPSPPGWWGVSTGSPSGPSTQPASMGTGHLLGRRPLQRPLTAPEVVAAAGARDAGRVEEQGTRHGQGWVAPGDSGPGPALSQALGPSCDFLSRLRGQGSAQGQACGKWPVPPAPSTCCLLCPSPSGEEPGSFASDSQCPQGVAEKG